MGKIKLISPRNSNLFKVLSFLSKMNLLPWLMEMKENPFLAPLLINWLSSFEVQREFKEIPLLLLHVNGG
jgi:hypothetical protein